MIEGHIIFNAILYSIVIAYILYINFSAYYQTGTGFLKALVNLFQNWIFRTVYLLIVGFFALDLFPYGGFVLAILLTIAFLNTNMLVYKKDVEESFTIPAEQDERKKLPSDGTVAGTMPTISSQQATASPAFSQTGTVPNVSGQTGTAPTTFSQTGTAPNVSGQTGTVPNVSGQTAPVQQTFPAGTPQITPQMGQMPPPPPSSSFATQQLQQQFK